MTNEEFQKTVLEELKSLRKDMSDVKSDMSDMKSEMSEMKTDIANLEGQSSETNRIVKTLLHSTETMNAEIAGLKVTTASAEAIAKVENKIDALNVRLFHQEADIQMLKKVR